MGGGGAVTGTGAGAGGDVTPGTREDAILAIFGMNCATFGSSDAASGARKAQP